MYQGFSKDNGSIIAAHNSQVTTKVDLVECIDSISAEESLICQDESENEIVLISRLDKNGDLSWHQGLTKEQVYKRTVGMGMMTSMLHDTERNTVYESAIKALIDNFITKVGRKPIVIDIGTGTGLLALFCIRHGAEHVFGFEMFEKMAEIARSVVEENGQSENITIISAKSSDIEALPVKADLVISELLDSALLGESVINAHSDAISRLMHATIASVSGEEDCVPMQERVIPYRGVVYATLVDSAEVKCMHDVAALCPSELQFDHRRDPAIRASCRGGWPLVPLHWERYLERGAKELSTACPVLDFDFFNSIATEESFVAEAGDTASFSFGEGCEQTDISVVQCGTVHGVLLWWKLFLLPESIDTEHRLMYCTAPNACNWQDHWQQTVYPLADDVPCQAGDTVRVTCAHNTVSIRVRAEMVAVAPVVQLEQPAAESGHTGSTAAATKRQKTSTGGGHVRLPGSVEMCREMMDLQCGCGWHTLCGADRIAMLNDGRRAAAWNEALASIVQQLLASNSGPATGALKFVLDVSDGSHLSLFAALMQRQHRDAFKNIRFVSKESKYMSQLFHSQLACSNGLETSLFIWDGEDADDVRYYFEEEEDEVEGNMGYGDKNEEQEADELAPALVAVPDEGGHIDIDDGGSSNNETIKYSALISECYYYQMHAQSTWQALAFHYKRTALHSQLAADCIISPNRAVIMCALVELTDLNGSYGPAGSIQGFDHNALDRVQDNWHTHLFPYKLGNYRKKMLTAPAPIAALDYTQPLSGAPGTPQVELITTGGRADAVIVWVDYQLTVEPDSLVQSLTLASNGVLDFPSYLTLNIKFLPASVEVTAGQRLRHSTEFTLGASDFKYNFRILKAE